MTGPDGASAIRTTHLRVVATLGTLAAVAWTQTGDARSWTAVLILSTYVAVTAGVQLAARRAPIRSALTRPASLFADVAVTTLGIYYSGDAAAAMLPVYVTLCAEYGMRFGARYLWWAATLGAAGVLCLWVLDNGALRSHLTVVGLAGGIAIAMVYLDALWARRRSAATDRGQTEATAQSADTIPPPRTAEGTCAQIQAPAWTIARETPLMDERILADLRCLSGNRDFMAVLADGFVEETQSLSQDLQQAVENHDHGAYQDCLYALKSSAANIGARQLHQLCQQALAADAGDSDNGGRQWLSRIRQCICRTHRALLDTGVMGREARHQD